MKQPKKQKTKDDYQKMYDYRDNLTRGGIMAHDATKATAKHFKCDIMTVYTAVQWVRSNGKKGGENAN